MLIESIETICHALKAAWPDAHVYPEEVAEGLQYPAFLVRLARVDASPELFGRVRRDIEFAVTYMRPDYRNLDYYAELPHIEYALTDMSYRDFACRGDAFSVVIKDRALQLTGHIIGCDADTLAAPEYTGGDAGELMGEMEINDTVYVKHG